MITSADMFSLCAAATAYSLPSLGASSATPVRHQLINMRADAGITMAKDIKGKAIWDLRLAAASDSAAIAELMGAGYTKELVNPLVQGGLCVVGESGRSLVSAALVHTFKGVRENGAIDENAELLSVIAADGVPNDVSAQHRAIAARESREYCARAGANDARDSHAPA